MKLRAIHRRIEIREHLHLRQRGQREIAEYGAGALILAPLLRRERSHTPRR